MGSEQPEETYWSMQCQRQPRYICRVYPYHGIRYAHRYFTDPCQAPYKPEVDCCLPKPKKVNPKHMIQKFNVNCRIAMSETESLEPRQGGGDEAPSKKPPPPPEKNPMDYTGPPVKPMGGFAGSCYPCQPCYPCGPCSQQYIQPCPPSCPQPCPPPIVYPCPQQYIQPGYAPCPCPLPQERVPYPYLTYYPPPSVCSTTPQPVCLEYPYQMYYPPPVVCEPQPCQPMCGPAPPPMCAPCPCPPPCEVPCCAPCCG